MDMNQTPNESGENKNTLHPNRWAWTLACLGSMLVVAYGGAAAFSTSLDDQWTIVLAIGVALLIAWFAIEQRQLRQSAGRRAGKRFVSSVGLSALALSVAVALSLIALRFDHQFDLTESKRHTLSEQSKSVLNSLDQNIKLIAFFTDDALQTKIEFESLTSTMKLETDKLTVEIYDPIQSNLVASQYLPLSPYGTVFLEMDGKNQKIENDFGEEKIMGSLIQFISEDKHLICFTTGHREMTLNDYESQAGMGLFLNAMLGQNYRERAISLVGEQGVPEDCEVVIVAGPMEDFLEIELEMLSVHVKRGKDLMVALESVLAQSQDGEITNQRTPKLAAHMERFGISVGSEFVVELSPAYQIPGLDESAFVMVQDSYADHAIITSKNKLSAFYGSREVKRKTEAPGFSVVELMKTSPDSLSGGIKELQSQMGRPGPIAVMAISEVIDAEVIEIGKRTLELETPTPENDAALPLSKATTPSEKDEDSIQDHNDVEGTPGGKVLVSGAKSIFSNAWTGSPQFQNLDIGLNAIAWMVDETAQISARTPEAKADKAVTLTAYQALLLWLSCLILAPGLILMGALGTWRSRRSK